ncbi:hypothetical protein Hanom_Chr03g00214051 [Helianthus anomalus]
MSESSKKRTRISTHHLLTSHMEGSNCFFMFLVQKGSVVSELYTFSLALHQNSFT